MAIQVASPFTSYDIMSEGVSTGALYGINPASGRSCSYVYTPTSDAIQILRNLQYSIPNQSRYPALSISYEIGSFSRPLPLNFNESERVSSRRQVVYIDESLPYSTSGLYTCTIMNLGTGNINSPSVIPSQLGIRYKNFDFYCEMSSYGGAELSEENGKRMRAFLLISNNLPNYTGNINVALNENNAIELNVEYLGDLTCSISGYIKDNAKFFDNSLWTLSSSRLSLVVYNEAHKTFGANGMGSITFYFPDNNADTWNRIWGDTFVPTKESQIFNSIMSSNSVSFIESALNSIPTLGSEFAFWLTPMGYLLSIQNFAIVIGLALIFIILEKFAI